MVNKCICIKSFYNDNETVAFRKHIEYKYTDKMFTTREYPEGYNVMFSKGEYLFFRKYQDPSTPKGYSMFSTHFKTLKEIRKEKLNKISKNMENI